MFKIFFWVGYLNSGINPVLYTIFNKDFRHAFKRLFRFSKHVTRWRRLLQQTKPESHLSDIGEIFEVLFWRKAEHRRFNFVGIINNIAFSMTSRSKFSIQHLMMSLVPTMEKRENRVFNLHYSTDSLVVDGGILLGKSTAKRWAPQTICLVVQCYLRTSVFLLKKATLKFLCGFCKSVEVTKTLKFNNYIVLFVLFLSFLNCYSVIYVAYAVELTEFRNC